MQWQTDYQWHEIIPTDPEYGDNCEACGLAIHMDSKTGKWVHGFDPQFE